MKSIFRIVKFIFFGYCLLAAPAWAQALPPAPDVRFLEAQEALFRNDDEGALAIYRAIATSVTDEDSVIDAHIMATQSLASTALAERRGPRAHEPGLNGSMVVPFSGG